MGMHVTLHGKNDTFANGADGTWQPVKVNAAGQLSIAMLNGELAQFNRLAGGAIVNYAAVTADTTVATGAGILYGIVCISAGTMAAIYDNTSASGTILIPSQALTAGQMFTFSGVGITTTIGIHADWTSGTWLVLYV